MNQIQLEQFMESKGRDILSFCYYLIGNREEAEDLCQDSLVYGFEMAERIEDEEHAKRYFLSVAVKLWKNRKRKYAWRKRIVDESVIPMAEMESERSAMEDNPEQAAVKAEEKEIIRECIKQLSEKKQMVILLYYMEGYKEKEISEILNLPQGTVKSRLRIAKNELASMLSKRL